MVQPDAAKIVKFIFRGILVKSYFDVPDFIISRIYIIIPILEKGKVSFRQMMGIDTYQSPKGVM